MKWTTEHPKHLGSGYYWYYQIDDYGSHTRGEKPFVVHVTFDGEIENAYVQRHGLVDRIPLLEFAAAVERPAIDGDHSGSRFVGNWYGPISHPLKPIEMALESLSYES